jgi:hypothetical protein
MNNRNDKMFERLILMGAVEPAGMDSESGEMLFSFSEDIDTIAPGLAKLVEDKIASTVMTLWSKGFVDLKYNEDSEDPLVFVTEQCDNEVAVSVLPDFEKTVLTNIIDHFKQDEV